MSRSRRLRRVVLRSAAGLVSLCLLAVAVCAASNIGLPERSRQADRLPADEKARLMEVTHLRQNLGDLVWPGWAEAEIPIILYNESYAFLVGYPDPPPGWQTVPAGKQRGGAWEPVAGDSFDGRSYYRQRLADPQESPQAFVVKVGGRVVASMQTREYSAIAFYQGFRLQVPPLLRYILPYRLVWSLLMGDSETYMGSIEHEAFHVWQATVAPGRLSAAERTAPVERRYPWDDVNQAQGWQEETRLLTQAVQAADDAEARALARGFLDRRWARRAGLASKPELVDFERQREWLEGLAKYAELEIQRLPLLAPGYLPVTEMAADGQFRGYAGRLRFYEGQLGQVSRLSGESGETRLYYTGMAQAVLLDRFLPGWKTRILVDDAAGRDIMLEDMLVEALG